jgi:hypothetical protein
MVHLARLDAAVEHARAVLVDEGVEHPSDVAGLVYKVIDLADHYDSLISALRRYGGADQGDPVLAVDWWAVAMAEPHATESDCGDVQAA